MQYICNATIARLFCYYIVLHIPHLKSLTYHTWPAKGRFTSSPSIASTLAVAALLYLCYPEVTFVSVEMVGRRKIVIGDRGQCIWDSEIEDHVGLRSQIVG